MCLERTFAPRPIKFSTVARRLTFSAIPSSNFLQCLWSDILSLLDSLTAFVRFLTYLLTYISTTLLCHVSEEAMVAVKGTDIKRAWRQSWMSAPVVNAHLVAYSTIRQPGFDLPRQHWSLLNRFCTAQLGRCGTYKKRCRITDSWDLCSCGRDPDNVSQCRLMPDDEARWRFVQTSLCRWWCGAASSS